MTNVLTIGGGGREHAAVEALQRSGAKVFAVMKNRNPGISDLAEKVLLADEKDSKIICDFARDNKIELAFVGPEAPLEAGVVDALEAIGIRCASPTKAAARIETSKAFMRLLVQNHGIEGNLGFASFSDANSAKDYARNAPYELVVKPIGLTGGKGVKVEGEHLHNYADICAYIDEIFEQNIGGAGVILEERAVGEEFTQMVFCDGERIAAMPLVQDHKRAYDGDVGPNTGGMGSYSDANHLLPFISNEERQKGLQILQSIVDALRKEGCPYRGPMYGQFMLTVKGPRIIEINARFGDPEAMNVLPILKSGFTDICKRMAEGKLNGPVLFNPLATVCKYVVPEGYGVKSISGKPLVVDEKAVRKSGAVLYYANVDIVDGRLLTATSRSVGVVGMAADLETAEKNCEEALKHVKGEFLRVRHDIGKKELVQKRVDHMRELRRE